MPFLGQCGKELQRRIGHRLQCGECAFHTGYLRRQTLALGTCNTYFFSTVTTVARTRLSITLYLNCLSCLWGTQGKSRPEVLYHNMYIISALCITQYPLQVLVYCSKHNNHQCCCTNRPKGGHTVFLLRNRKMACLISPYELSHCTVYRTIHTTESHERAVEIKLDSVTRLKYQPYISGCFKHQ